MRIQNLKIPRALSPQETLLSSLLCDLYSNDWRRYDNVMSPLGRGRRGVNPIFKLTYMGMDLHEGYALQAVSSGPYWNKRVLAHDGLSFIEKMISGIKKWI